MSTSTVISTHSQHSPSRSEQRTKNNTIISSDGHGDELLVLEKELRGEASSSIGFSNAESIESLDEDCIKITQTVETISRKFRLSL
jgi:hypothetical protein